MLYDVLTSTQSGYAYKTFTTLETLTNAVAARQWVRDTLGDDAVPMHFVAVITSYSIHYTKLYDG